MEAAPDALLCVNAEGVIVFANDQTIRLFGYERAELVGQPVEILVPDAVPPGHARHRAEYLADPRPRPMGLGMRLTACYRDGRTFPAEISLSVLGTGADMLIMTAVRDITDRLKERAERDRLMSQARRVAVRIRRLRPDIRVLFMSPGTRGRCSPLRAGPSPVSRSWASRSPKRTCFLWRAWCSTGASGPPGNPGGPDQRGDRVPQRRHSRGGRGPAIGQ